MRSVILAAIVVAATAASAVAQPSLTPLSDPEQPPARVPQMTAPVAESPKPRTEPELSEDTATMLAVGTTLGGIGAIAAGIGLKSAPIGWIGVAGVFIGPSAGHLYAGEYGHSAGMTLLRGAGAVTFLVGVIKATTVIEADGIGGNADSRKDGVPLMVLGASAFLGGTIYDLIDAHRAAHRENSASIAIAPLVSNHTTGLALAGSF